jgi:ubiquinone/menaquinone biosynthesis C-methylase UbiE
VASVDKSSHDAASYGARLADHYDDIYGGVFDTDGAVDFLAKLASGGRILEFGVGTGRIAIPLSERSLDVWGVDGSAAMLEQLRAKDGGQKVKTLLRGFRHSQSRGRIRSSPLVGQHHLRHAKSG